MIGTKENGLNIKDLVIDEPSPVDYRFDPLVEMRKHDDLYNIKKYLQDQSKIKEKGPEFWNALCNFSFLFPEIELNLKFSDLKTKKYSSYSWFVPEAEAVKNFFGQKYLDKISNKRVWNEVRQDLKEDISDSNWRGSLPIHLASYKRLFGSLDDLNISKEDEDYILDVYNDPGHLTLPYIAERAASLRVAFPDRMEDIRIPKNLWHVSEETLNRLRRKSQWALLVTFAQSLRILAAEEVNVDENGMKLTFKPIPPKISEPIPLPETRRF